MTDHKLIDKAQRWNVGVDALCKLCLTEEESRDHMSFSHPFGKTLRSRVSQKPESTSQVGNWSNKLEWAKKHLGEEAPLCVLSCISCCGMLIYILFGEREMPSTFVMRLHQKIKSMGSHGGCSRSQDTDCS